MKKTSEDIDKKKVVLLLQPSRPVLCTTVDPDGSDHIAPFGWCMPVSQKPPVLAVAIHHSPEKSKSLENIERTGEFVINLPHSGLAEETIRTAFPKDGTLHKFNFSMFTRQESRIVTPVGIKECVASLECKLAEVQYIGDHALIIGNVVFATFEPLAYKGMAWNVEHFQPLIHLGHRSYKDGTQVHEIFDGKNTPVELIIETKSEETKSAL